MTMIIVGQENASASRDSVKSRLSPAIAFLVVLTGCGAESVLVKSDPPGALLSVNRVQIGTTPCVYSVPTNDLGKRPLNYLVEKDGYRPEQGELKVRRSPGRLIGSIFTVGILRIFRGLRVFRDNPTEIALTPLDATTGIPVTSEMAEKMRRLDKLREAHLITDDEYRKYRAEVLLGPPSSASADSKAPLDECRHRCVDRYRACSVTNVVTGDRGLFETFGSINCASEQEDCLLLCVGK